MIRFLASVSILALLAVNASAATLWALPSGSDTQGDGSQEHPYATVAKAWVAAQSGDTIMCSGVHQPKSSFFSVQHDLTIIASNGCTLQPLPGQSRIIGISVPGSALTLQGITLDCAGAGYGILLYGGGTSPTSVTLAGGNTIENCTQSAVQGAAADMRVVLQSTGTTFVLPSARSVYRLLNWTVGSFASMGDTLTMTQSTPGSGYLDASASAIGPTVAISDLKFTINGAPYPNATEAIDIRNIPNASIYRVVGEMHSTTGACRLIHVSAYGPTPLDSRNVTIDHPVLLNDCKGGGNIVVGQDGPSVAPPGMANNPTVNAPVLTGSAFSQANALHMIEYGYIDGGTIRDGICITGRYCTVIKGVTGSPLITGMVAVDMLTNAFYQKGGEGAVFDHDTAYFYQGDPRAQVAFAAMDDGNGIAWDGHGMTVTNSTVSFDESVAGSFITVNPGYSLRASSNNDYWSQKDNGYWSITGTIIRSLATWQTWEPTANDKNPHLTQKGLLGQ